MEFQVCEMLSRHLSQIKFDDFDDFWNENIFKQDFLSPTSYYVVAIANDEVLGFAGLNFVFDEAHISNIAVRKDNRGLGIGSRLLEALIKKAKCSSRLITLEVNEQNFSAIHLYQKYGFETVRKKEKVL